MITDKDLQRAVETMANDERQTLGELPTAEEMLAYSLGELPPAEEHRIRKLLVAYPKLAETLSRPFPEDDAPEGAPGYVSAAEVDRRWSDLQTRIHGSAAPLHGAAAAPHPVAVMRPSISTAAPPSAKVLQFWRAAAAVAAALMVVSGALFLQARKETRELSRQLSMPRMAGEAQTLFPGGRRGVDDVPLLIRDGDSYLLSAAVPGGTTYDHYHVEIVDPSTTPNRVRWSSAISLRPRADSVTVLVPHDFLSPGLHEMVLYGVSGDRRVRLSSFAMQVSAP